MPGRRTILLFGLLLGSVFLYLAVHTIGWSALTATLRQARPGYIGLGLVSLLFYFGVKAWRWQYLIRPFSQASAAQLLPAVLAGLAGNQVFPHAGEIPRAVLAGKRVNASASALLASIAIERIFDSLTILLLVLAVLVPAGRMSPDIQTASYFVGSLCAGLLAIVAMFLFRTEACLRLAERLLSLISDRFGARALAQLRAAGAGFGAIAVPRLFVPIFLLSVIQWLLIVATIAFSMESIGATVILAGAVSALLMNIIGLTLPAAPGHVGTVQLAFIVGLAPFGVTHADALAGSVIYNFLIVVPTVILGISGLRRTDMGLR